MTLDEALEILELPQIQLAKLLNCHPSTVNGWIAGRPIRCSSYHKLLKVLGLNDGDLDIVVSMRAVGKSLGDTNQKEMPPQSSSTITKRRGRKRTPEQIDRMVRGRRYAKKTTVTTVTEWWEV